jgi:hypothetical protein
MLLLLRRNSAIILHRCNNDSWGINNQDKNVYIASAGCEERNSMLATRRIPSRYSKVYVYARFELFCMRQCNVKYCCSWKPARIVATLNAHITLIPYSASSSNFFARLSRSTRCFTISKYSILISVFTPSVSTPSTPTPVASYLFTRKSLHARRRCRASKIAICDNMSKTARRSLGPSRLPRLTSSQVPLRFLLSPRSEPRPSYMRNSRTSMPSSRYARFFIKGRYWLMT